MAPETLRLPADPFGSRPRKRRQFSVDDSLSLQVEQLVSPDDLLEASSAELRHEGFKDPFQAAYSADVWAASLALAKAIAADSPALVPPEARVLELGCGCGALPALTACRLRRARVTATDGSLPALSLTAANARANGVSPHCGPLPDAPPPGDLELWHMDWTSPETWLPPHRRNFDVVLAADVIYEKDLRRPLAETARAHARPGAMVVVVSASRRSEEQFSELAAACGLEGMVREDVTMEWDGKPYTAKFEWFRAV